MSKGFGGVGLVLMCLALSLACHLPAAEGLVPVTTPQGATIWAELADDPQKRAKGLMFRESLDKERGMLFTFPESQRWTFWMKNTNIPLDIIWMDDKKEIVYVESNVPTCHRSDELCPQYRSYREATYVLEVGAGVAESLKLEEGVILAFEVEAPRF